GEAFDLQPAQQPDGRQRAFALREHAGRQDAVLRPGHCLAVAALCAARRDLQLLSDTPWAARVSGRLFLRQVPGSEMQHGDPRDGAGSCEGVDLASLARREGTPLHVYSAGAIRERLQALHAALAGLDAGVRYAVKANGNEAILRLVA